MKNLALLILLLFTVSLSQAQIIINEVLADPASDDLLGDANGDGVRDSSDDEFIELLNISDSSVDLSNWEIHDNIGLRHLFEENIMLEAGKAIVIFGGNSPEEIGNSAAYSASTGSLSLNNSGDSLTLINENKTIINKFIYASPLGSDVSINRAVDGDTLSPLINHDDIANTIGAFSPGTKSDGSAFDLITATSNLFQETHKEDIIYCYSIQGELLYQGKLSNFDVETIDKQYNIIIIKSPLGTQKIIRNFR